jgi:hypothetical protein
MSTHSLKEYKFSKVICNDLKIILSKIDEAIKNLSPYKLYIPVQRTLLILQEEKKILEAHHMKYLEIRREKGRIAKNNNGT